MISTPNAQLNCEVNWRFFEKNDSLQSQIETVCEVNGLTMISVWHINWNSFN
tara:strand:+ start:3905 stop:4060 length:156 start_codon:yes stop_codon:yes gene_type:complete